MRGAAAVLDVDGLTVAYRQDGRESRIVHAVSFAVHPGEVVALVGQSGSGKSTTAQAVIGLLPDNGRRESGAIRLKGQNIAGWSQRRLDRIRGAEISLVPQDPGSSLNPVKTIGAQVGEILRLHTGLHRAAVERRVVELLERVGLSEPALRARQYPHELSGGMRQRVLIAIAVALKPALVIADEPTSALDVTVQRRVLDLLDELRREDGTAILLVTHDLGIAADRADRLVVMKDGRIQEAGETARVLAAPASPYTAKLLADAPAFATARRAPRPDGGEDLVVVEDLVQDFPTDRGPFRAVDGVSFRVRRGTTHAIVGESGSGKTTTARAIVGFGRPTTGRVLVDGRDIAALEGEARRHLRQTVQFVYQNPFGSLDPRQSVFSIVEEPLLNFGRIGRADRADKVLGLLDRVGLSRALAPRRPHALSGGQRQRVAIARALVLDPALVVLDEAVSALDVTVQAQILALLDALQRDLGLTYLFVSHDLAVVRQIADTVSVFQGGRQVESGPVDAVFGDPQHGYTRDLIAAIPGRRANAPALSPNG